MRERKRIFLHGLEGSSQGVKARLLRDLYPDMLAPDFSGSLEERMQQLRLVMGEMRGWTITGSSFGGLMGVLFTCQHPEQVEKLVLLAPALIWPDFASAPPAAVDTPTVVYHGSRDSLVPLEPTRWLAGQVFRNLEFHVVDDDHGLYRTVHEIDWKVLLD